MKQEAYYKGKIINGTNPVYGFIKCVPWEEKCNYIKDKWTSHDYVELKGLHELLKNLDGSHVKIYGSNEFVNRLVTKQPEELETFVEEECTDEKFGNLLLECKTMLVMGGHDVVTISEKDNAHADSVAFQAYNLWKQEKLDWQEKET